MLVGSFSYCLDKNRLLLPPKVAKKIGSRVFLAKSPDGCILIFSQDKLAVVRKFFEVEMAIVEKSVIKTSSNWRVGIPDSFAKFANFKRKVVVVGCVEYLEVWDETEWEKQI